LVLLSGRDPVVKLVLPLPPLFTEPSMEKGLGGFQGAEPDLRAGLSEVAVISFLMSGKESELLVVAARSRLVKHSSS
jgi:hypothetical protein